MFLSHIISFGRFNLIFKIDSTLSSFKLHLRLPTVNPPAEKHLSDVANEAGTKK